MKSPLYRGCALTDHVEQVPATGYPMFVEPKHDGFRLMARVEPDGTVHLMVRHGECAPYDQNLPHIKAAISALNIRGCWFDGELRGATWNETARLARLKRPSAADQRAIEDNLRFHIFDFMIDEACEVRTIGRSKTPKVVYSTPARLRRKHLFDLVGRRLPTLRAITMVEQCVAENEDQARCLFAAFLAAGFEGVVCKSVDAPYVCDSRAEWIAVKPVKTVDAVIVGVVEGEGKHRGRMGALECRKACGAAFSVGTGFSDAERARVWAERSTLLGRWVEVRMQDATEVAVARNPTFERWRDDRGGSADA